MPVLIAAESHDRWLANIEPDPRDLLAVLLGANERASSELMKTSPISTRVNKPDDDTHLLTPVPAIFSRQNMKRPDLHTGKPGVSLGGCTEPGALWLRLGLLGLCRQDYSGPLQSRTHLRTVWLRWRSWH